MIVKQRWIGNYFNAERLAWPVALPDFNTSGR